MKRNVVGWVRSDVRIRNNGGPDGHGNTHSGFIK